MPQGNSNIDTMYPEPPGTRTGRALDPFEAYAVPLLNSEGKGLNSHKSYAVAAIRRTLWKIAAKKRRRTTFYRLAPSLESAPPATVSGSGRDTKQPRDRLTTHRRPQRRYSAARHAAQNPRQHQIPSIAPYRRTLLYATRRRRGRSGRVEPWRSRARGLARRGSRPSRRGAVAARERRLASH